MKLKSNVFGLRSLGFLDKYIESYQTCTIACSPVHLRPEILSAKVESFLEFRLILFSQKSNRFQHFDVVFDLFNRKKQIVHQAPRAPNYIFEMLVLNGEKGISSTRKLSDTIYTSPN